MKSIKMLILAALLSLTFVGTASATPDNLTLTGCGQNAMHYSFDTDASGWYHVYVYHGTGGDTGWQYFALWMDNSPHGTVYNTDSSTSVLIQQASTGETVWSKC